MKILTIRLKNLASIEGTFEVDFTVEPLRSAGIFAISGPTGAGKSTILDALCLALYDKTPRFAASGESLFLSDVGENQVNQSDVKNILRRGTGEGFAEVDFLGRPDGVTVPVGLSGGHAVRPRVLYNLRRFRLLIWIRKRICRVQRLNFWRNWFLCLGLPTSSLPVRCCLPKTILRLF